MECSDEGSRSQTERGIASLMVQGKKLAFGVNQETFFLSEHVPEQVAEQPGCLSRLEWVGACIGGSFRC